MVFSNPWRERPRLRAARVRLPPARASATSMNRRSNCSRASASRPDDTLVAALMTDGSSAGRTRPRAGAATASDAMTFCSSRTLPGQARELHEHRRREFGPRTDLARAGSARWARKKWWAQVPIVAQKPCARFLRASCAPAANAHSRPAERTNGTVDRPVASWPNAEWKPVAVRRCWIDSTRAIPGARSRPLFQNQEAFQSSGRSAFHSAADRQCFGRLPGPPTAAMGRPYTTSGTSAGSRPPSVSKPRTGVPLGVPE
jgi:hypothetical protein